MDTVRSNDEDRIVARSKELLAGDRLRSLESKGRGKASLVSEEVKATEQALKALLVSDKGKSLSREAQENEDDSEHNSVPSSPTIFRSIHVFPEPFEPSYDRPRTYLSREAQRKIADIMGTSGIPLVPERPERDCDMLDAIIQDLRAERAGRDQHELHVVPNPELLCMDRRSLAPHVSAIYDQAIGPSPRSRTATH